MIFLDSANLQEIKEAVDSRIVSGVTTNPSIIAKEPKGDFLKHIGKIVDLVGIMPLSVEVFSNNPTKMVEEAKNILRRFEDSINNINIKIPVSWQTMPVINALRTDGIDVNATCIFTEAQAIAAIDAGASYVSFFTNRMRDIGINPFGAISAIKGYILNRGFSSKIICGSIRGHQDITTCLLSGADIVTAGLKHIKAMCAHTGTDHAVNQFNNDFAAWMEG